MNENNIGWKKVAVWIGTQLARVETERDTMKQRIAELELQLKTAENKQRE